MNHIHLHILILYPFISHQGPDFQMPERRQHCEAPEWSCSQLVVFLKHPTSWGLIFCLNMLKSSPWIMADMAKYPPKPCHIHTHIYIYIHRNHIHIPTLAQSHPTKIPTMSHLHPNNTTRRLGNRNIIVS